MTERNAECNSKTIGSEMNNEDEILKYTVFNMTLYIHCKNSAFSFHLSKVHGGVSRKRNEWFP